MPVTMHTPGVYVEEVNAFPNSVVEVATAVPAFIGYTEMTDAGDKSLLNQPIRISSLHEYHVLFGGAAAYTFKLVAQDDDAATADFTDTDAKGWLVQQTDANHLLYRSIVWFFDNGGGSCYIVSVGDYTQDLSAAALREGLAPLKRESEVTMVVMPDAMLLAQDNCFEVQQAAIKHCGADMRNRIAILDVWGGYRARQHPDGDCIEQFRTGIGTSHLDYATAYYPWLHTSVVQGTELDYRAISNRGRLQALLRAEFKVPEKIDSSTPENIVAIAADITLLGKDLMQDDGLPIEARVTAIAQLNQRLLVMSRRFKTIMQVVQQKLNLLPPAAAMAGVYTTVDNERGVWKAPANVSIVGAVKTAVTISHDEQEDLNVSPVNGKSVNAIRSFVGQGILVWGARTLDGNSLDWRYVNVRRTVIMLEESIKCAAKAFVFAPNDASTWVALKAMISNFLTSVWQRGGLAGAVPEDGFSVHVGLGETMTSLDILEGRLQITVLVAVTRPAEFIEMTFQQEMQKS